jgi:hypothetical protein
VLLGTTLDKNENGFITFFKGILRPAFDVSELLEDFLIRGAQDDMGFYLWNASPPVVV